MKLRKFGNILLGDATSAQLFLSALLGIIIGFTPSFLHAPLLMCVAILLVLILRVNIAYVVILAALSKAISFLLIPITFWLGTILLDGFLQPLFKWMINAPVLAFAGFQYYMVTGGLLLGIILGIIVGYLIARFFKTLRHKMAALQGQSEKYQRYTQKWWLKLISWTLLGQSIHKVDWTTISNKKLKHPFRLSGVIVVIVFIILAVVFQTALQSRLFKQVLISQLEKVNGATVNLAKADINLAKGTVVVEGLAMTDPNHLDRNLFYAETVALNIDMAKLLSKKMVINDITIHQAQSGNQRQHPGVLIAPKPFAAKASAASQKTTTAPPTQAASPVTKYVSAWQKWQPRLLQAKRFLTTFSGASSHLPNKKNRKATQQQDISQYGHFALSADYLISKQPTLIIEKFSVDRLSIASLPKHTFSITARNLSTQPALLQAEPKITINSADKNLYAQLTTSQIAVKLHNLPAQALLSSIKMGKGHGVEAKYITLETSGNWHMKAGQVQLNLPITTTLYDVKINMAGKQQSLPELPFKFVLSGRLLQPNVQIDPKQFQNLLLNAGKEQLKSKAKDYLKKRPF